MAKHHPDLIMCRKQPGICKRHPIRPRDTPTRARHSCAADGALCSLARSCGEALREVRRQVPDLRLVRAAVHARAHLRRVQLWLLPGALPAVPSSDHAHTTVAHTFDAARAVIGTGAVRHLRWPRHLGRLLLQGVHAKGGGPRRLSEDCQPRLLEDGSLLRTKKVWLQEAVVQAHGSGGARRPAAPAALVCGTSSGCGRALWLTRRDRCGVKRREWRQLCAVGPARVSM